MVKSKNIIAGLGVVAGLGVALLPLGAFAAESNNVSHTIRGIVGDVISVELTSISNGHSLTLEDNSVISKVNLTPGDLNATLEHVVTVHTNTRNGYGLQMYGTSLVGSGENAKAALKYIDEWGTDADEIRGNEVAAHTLDTITIDSITSASTLGEDTNVYGWGYKVKKNADSGPQTGGVYSDPATDYATTFAAIPTAAGTNVKEVSANRSAEELANYSDAFTFQYGIRPATTQLAGSYEGTVVYRAVSGI